MELAANDVALSPDGKTIALVAFSDQANKYMLWTHGIGAHGAAVVPGTEDASHPFWSGDGPSLGFFSEGKLRIVDAFPRTSPQVLCDAAHGRGGTWNREGTILFSPDTFTGLYRISSSGVAADGQKFLINTKVDAPSAAPLSFILNWVSEMEK